MHFVTTTGYCIATWANLIHCQHKCGESAFENPPYVHSFFRGSFFLPLLFFTVYLVEFFFPSAMNQSESECQDAFSQTLGKTPLTKQNQHQQRPPNHDQQQGYHSHYQRDERKQQRRTSSSLRKGQSINRLSRMFENDVSNGQSSNATHQLIKGAKPKLPTKPPSLRSQQSTSNSGSSAAIQTHLAKSATSKADDSNVDETSLAFRDVRARFQQSGTDGNIKVKNMACTTDSNRITKLSILSTSSIDYA